MKAFSEVAPPGWGHTKAEKEKTKPNKPKSKIGGSAHEFDKDLKSGKFKGLPGDKTMKDKKASMFKLMWSMKNKGDKPHYKPGVKNKLKAKYKEKNEMIDAKKIRNYKNVPNSVVAKADKEAQKVKDQEEKGTLELPQMPTENLSLAPKGKGKKAAKALYKEDDIDEGPPTPKFKPLKHKVYSADASIPPGARGTDKLGKPAKYKVSKKTGMGYGDPTNEEIFVERILELDYKKFGFETQKDLIEYATQFYANEDNDWQVTTVTTVGAGKAKKGAVAAPGSGTIAKPKKAKESDVNKSIEQQMADAMKEKFDRDPRRATISGKLHTTRTGKGSERNRVGAERKIKWGKGGAAGSKETKRRGRDDYEGEVDVVSARGKGSISQFGSKEKPLPTKKGRGLPKSRREFSNSGEYRDTMWKEDWKDMSDQQKKAKAKSQFDAILKKKLGNPKKYDSPIKTKEDVEIDEKSPYNKMRRDEVVPRRSGGQTEIKRGNTKPSSAHQMERGKKKVPGKKAERFPMRSSGPKTLAGPQGKLPEESLVDAVVRELSNQK